MNLRIQKSILITMIRSKTAQTSDPIEDLYIFSQIIIMPAKERIKVVVLTNKDRKLLEGIHNSLEDIRKGKIKPFLAESLRKHK